MSCLPSTPAARTVSPLLSQAGLCLSHCAQGCSWPGRWSMVEVKEAIALWGWFMAGTCIPVADC